MCAGTARQQRRASQRHRHENEQPSASAVGVGSVSAECQSRCNSPPYRQREGLFCLSVSFMSLSALRCVLLRWSTAVRFLEQCNLGVCYERGDGGLEVDLPQVLGILCSSRGLHKLWATHLCTSGTGYQLVRARRCRWECRRTGRPVGRSAQCPWKRSASSARQRCVGVARCCRCPIACHCPQRSPTLRV